MDKTFKEEVLKAAAKTKEDKIALAPIACRLQEEFLGMSQDCIDADTEETLRLYASYSKVRGVLQNCCLVLSVSDEINDKEMTVALTEKQTLKFAQKLLSKYEQLNSINEKLRDLGIEPSTYK